MTRTLLLGVVLLLLGGVVGFELMPQGGRENGLSVLAPVAGVVRPVPAVVIDRGPEEVRTILARPLFAPGRRAPAAGAVAAADAPPSLPRVAGILMDGKQRSVIFASLGDVRPLVVAEGGEVNGFRVQSIEDGQVTVVGPNGPLVLHPTFDPSPPAPPARSGAAPSPLAGLTNIPGLPSLPGLPNLPPGAGLPGNAR